MTDERKELTTWKDVITGFLRSKRDKKEETYLKDKIKEVSERYGKINYFDNAEIAFVFNTRKNKKRKNESALSFQRRRAIKLLKFGRKPEGIDIVKEKHDYLETTKALAEKYAPVTWLTENCKNASSVNFATHVIKLTYSKIDSFSILDESNEIKGSYLTTSSLRSKAVDAVCGNQYAPIFQFLELELAGKKLVQQLSEDDNFFKCLAGEDESSENNLEIWTQGFKKSLDSGPPSTHFLAKQIYFPITQENNGKNPCYHLLCNIVSSSLAQSIHQEVFTDRKTVNKSVENDMFSDDLCKRFIQTSRLAVTASNHGNASQLNGKRGGKLQLFSCQPPVWHSQLKPPINKFSLFDDLYNARIKTELDYLRDFLLRFRQLDLSIRNPKRMRHLERWVNNIIDEFLFYVATIQDLPAGWSRDENIKLKTAHQYLLDPFRLDEDFQAARLSKDWQTQILNDFAQWMNHRLRRKDRQFTPQADHTRLWKKLLGQPLREHMEPIELAVKQQIREAV